MCSRRKTSYNSWSFYAKVLKKSSQALKKFPPYLGDKSKAFFLDLGKEMGDYSAKQWGELRGRLRNYELTGPLYSQYPSLAVCVKDYHNKLNGGKEIGLSNRWEKRNLAQRYSRLDERAESPKPTKHGANALTRVLYHGENSTRCKVDRQKGMAKMRQLRAELKGRFREMFGVNYGLTVGLFMKELVVVRIEIIRMTLC